MDATYWFLFPTAIVIAAVANGAGVGGATFFSPLFVVVLGLEANVAIGAALITEVFGFSSGVAAHARARANRLADGAEPGGRVGARRYRQLSCGWVSRRGIRQITSSTFRCRLIGSPM